MGDTVGAPSTSGLKAWGNDLARRIAETKANLIAEAKKRLEATEVGIATRVLPPIPTAADHCQDGSPRKFSSSGTPVLAPPNRTAPFALPDNTKLRAAWDALPLPGDKSATLYRMDRNVDAFASRWKTLAGAKQSFDTTYFIWEDDIMGMAYMGHMLKKAKQDGFQMRGMMDCVGSGPTNAFANSDYVKALVATDPQRIGFGVFHYRDQKHVGATLEKEIAEAAASKTPISQALACDHQKFAIADRKTVETGGRNMAAAYLSDPADNGSVFRDCDIHVESAVMANSSTRAFELEYNQPTTHHVQATLGADYAQQQGVMLASYLMMDAWLKAPDLTPDQKQALRTNPAERQRWAASALDTALKALPGEGVTATLGAAALKKLTALSLQLVSNTELRGRDRFAPKMFSAEVKFAENTSAITTVKKREIDDAFINLSKAAQRSIVHHNPYFVPPKSITAAMSQAANRGVRVTIGTNSPESTDDFVTQSFFINNWSKSEARVRNLRILVTRGHEKVHAKTSVIDNAITAIGSHNDDWISYGVNAEDQILVWSPSFAEDQMDSYMAIVADPTKKVVEYKVARDPKTQRVLLRNGQPVVEYGPECDTPKSLWEQYLTKRPMAAIAEKIPELGELDWAPLDPKTDFVIDEKDVQP